MLAEVAGTVSKVSVSVGDVIQAGDLIAVISYAVRIPAGVIEAHLRRGGGEPGHPREGEADPGEPLLHRAVELASRARRSTWRWRSSARSSATGTYDLDRASTPRRRAPRSISWTRPSGSRASSTAGSSGCCCAPAKGPAKLMTAGFSVVTNALNRVLGAQVLRDMQTFVSAFDTLFGGFRQRAAADLRAAPGRRYGVPRDRGAGAGRAARGGVLRRAARRGRHAARRAGRQPGQPRAPRHAVRATRRWPRRTRLRKREPAR